MGSRAHNKYHKVYFFSLLPQNTCDGKKYFKTHTLLFCVHKYFLSNILAILYGAQNYWQQSQQNCDCAVSDSSPRFMVLKLKVYTTFVRLFALLNQIFGRKFISTQCTSDVKLTAA